MDMKMVVFLFLTAHLVAIMKLIHRFAVQLTFGWSLKLADGGCCSQVHFKAFISV
jgi:hypothetical protein